MGDWLVLLEGERDDLVRLAAAAMPPEWEVLDQDGRFWLRAAVFADFPDSTAVHSYARDRFVPFLSGVVSMSPKSRPSGRIRVGANVVREQPNGPRESHLFIETTAAIMVIESASVVVVDDKGQTTPVAQPGRPDMPKVAFSHLPNPMVADALTFFGRASVREDWTTNLYKVLEIIKGDLASAGTNIAECEWATNAELKRFGEATNNAEVSGQEARHPPRPGQQAKPGMDFDAARSLVGSLLERWLLWKTSLAAGAVGS